ncbi:class I adenylate-forming enzyme family protein [Hellea balneolensis]|uniref:class I adenylate-forming enzyme family protein n=1 Tax=Hellea balneolensis TaxID=287478 RepID=UPI000427DC10|nr:fatty acid--CoA ligase family protein [Hellea balneolensis]
MNIHLLLQMASETMGNREALVCGETRLTFQELSEMAKTVAAKVGEGEKLAYLAEAEPVFPAALFGAALAGTQFVPLNYRLSEAQLKAQMKRITPAKLIGEKSISIQGIQPISASEILVGIPSERDASDEDGGVAVELFTSGTTGEPKSAILRHSNLMAYIFGTVEFMSAEEDEATLLTVPPYHIAGIAGVLSSTYAGRRMVQLPNFTAEAWIKLAKDEAVTNAFLVPTMLQRIVDTAEDSLDLPALRNIAYGGGKMPRSTIETAMRLLPHVNFTNAYGLTETSATICMLGPEDHRAAYESHDPAIQRRLGSAGRAIPSIELKVRSDEGELCGPEETGLVWVRGDQVSGEYKGMGSQLDSEGWFLTKDRGFLDAEGYLFIDGRADDVIVRGGENISPGEIEDVLRQHDGVKDVAAIAVTDTEWGEAVGLAIVCTSEVSDEDICGLVRSKLRSSRVPSVIKRMDELPYNETGKILRRVIRDSFAD